MIAFRATFLLRVALLGCVLILGATVSPRLEAEAAAGDARKILVMLQLPPEHYRPGSAYGGAYGDQLSVRARRSLAAHIARENGLTLVDDGWPMPSIGVDCYVMQVPEGHSIDDAIAQVSRDRRVAWSQRLQTFVSQGSTAPVPDDPLFAAEPAASQWSLASLHRFATGRGVMIAVIDSKVDAGHPDLAGQIGTSLDFVTPPAKAPEIHGTAVAAVIAGKANNGVGMVGIAPGAKLLALRACWQTGGGEDAPTLCNSLSLARALDYAISRHVDIINMSLAGPDDRLLGRLLALARGRGIAIVAAYDPDLPVGGFPASVPGVIAVTNRCGLASSASSIYCAPGDGIPAAYPGGKWFLANGSSFAAASVSGLVALARERRPSSSHVLLVAYGPKGSRLDACATLLATPSPGNCGMRGRGRADAM